MLPRWSNFIHFDNVMGSAFNDGTKHEHIAKQFIFAAYNVFDDNDRIAFLLLKAIRAYTILSIYLHLELHTPTTQDGAQAAVKMLRVCLQEYSNYRNDTETYTNVEAIAVSDDAEETDSDSASDSGSASGRGQDDPDSAASRVNPWNFPKAHLFQHAVRDIQLKGATKQYSTKMFESSHGPIRRTYQRQTNFKDIVDPILNRDHNSHIAQHIRRQIEDAKKAAEQHVCDSDDEHDESLPSNESTPGLHVHLGSTRIPCTFASLEEEFKSDRAFTTFQVRLNNFLNNSARFYPILQREDNKRIQFKANDTIIECRYLKVYYESMTTFRATVDRLRCSPDWGRNHAERRDCIILDTRHTMAETSPPNGRDPDCHSSETQ